MEYLLMLIRDETTPPPTPDEREAAWQSHEAFEEWCRTEDIGLVAAHALARCDQAKSVRRADGETKITDGASTDLRDVLAGLYVIDVTDLDVAIRVAKRMPSTGRVEIRPVLDIDTMETQ